MEILESPKSENDLNILLQEVNLSSFIGQLTEEELRQYITNRTIYFFYDDKEVVGFGAWEAINSEWTEIGPFYNLERYRGKGLGTLIVQHLVMVNAGKKLYAVTKNSIVKKMLVKFGFQNVSVLELPWPIYGHLMSKLSLSRLFNLGRKLSLEPVAQFIRTTEPVQLEAEKSTLPAIPLPEFREGESAAI